MSPRSLLRNPYLWGFLIGIVTLTAIRPLLRHVPEPPPILFVLPEYSLTDQEGKPFGSAELRGTTYIVSFFFTSCRSICPAVMHGMGRLQDGYAQRKIEGIRLVSISVDPEHDTPDVLRDYAERLKVDPARWTLLTGDPAKVRAIVVDGFKTPMDAIPESGATPMDIAHTGKLALVDGKGNVRGFYGTDDMGLDEAFNRAQHVAREARGG